MHENAFRTIRIRADIGRGAAQSGHGEQERAGSHERSGDMLVLTDRPSRSFAEKELIFVPLDELVPYRPLQSFEECKRWSESTARQP
jgi:hypothetical protein